jgi:hypothetical protein
LSIREIGPFCGMVLLPVLRVVVIRPSFEQGTPVYSENLVFEAVQDNLISAIGLSAVCIDGMWLILAHVVLRSSKLSKNCRVFHG